MSNIFTKIANELRITAYAENFNLNSHAAYLTSRFQLWLAYNHFGLHHMAASDLAYKNRFLFRTFLGLPLAISIAHDTVNQTKLNAWICLDSTV